MGIAEQTHVHEKRGKGASETGDHVTRKRVIGASNRAVGFGGTGVQWFGAGRGSRRRARLEAAPADGGRAGLGAESVGGHGVSVGLGLHCVEIAWGAVGEIALVD